MLMQFAPFQEKLNRDSGASAYSNRAPTIRLDIYSETFN